MSINFLKETILSKTARIGVIGLGYVGLPVAATFAEAGFDTLGLDIKVERVHKINAGISPIEGDEPGLAELIKKTINSGKLRATTSYSDISDRDVILVDVETPVDEQNIPRYEALKAALSSLADVLKPGALVVIESTIAPQTMQSVVLPILEKNGSKKVNLDFYLGNCPERVMPGKLLENLSSMSRVVGGGNQETAETMIALYRIIVNSDLDPVDWITAELVKTTENAYRDVQIAFANEVAKICEAVGGNVWIVRELVNKSPYRSMHLPGAGVGGHCIPKDPWLLAFGMKEKKLPLKIIPAARELNDSMPIHMVELINQAMSAFGKTIKGAKILVLGYAYLENSDDSRNSPSKVLVEEISRQGGSTVIHDPFVEEYMKDIYKIARECDAVVLMVAHSEYKTMDLAKLRSALKTPVLVDGRHIFTKEQLQENKFSFRLLGEANDQKI